MIFHIYNIYHIIYDKISYITDMILFWGKLSYCIEILFTKYKGNMKAESGQVLFVSFIVLCNWNLKMNDLIYLHII